MPFIASEPENKEYELIDSGVYQAVCAFFVDIGHHRSEYQGETLEKHQGVCVFELSEKMKDGKPFTMSKFYTVSLSSKANLRKDLESWRGKPFTAEELKGFDLERLIGANCMLNIIHVEKNGETKAKIATISPIPKNMPKMEKTLTEVPKWVNEMKLKSLEYTQSGYGEPSKNGGVPHPAEEDLAF